MLMKLGWLGTCGLVVLAWSLVGCDSGIPPVDSTLEEATVKGTINVQGKPLSGGHVQFFAGNIARKVGPALAPIGKDGSYTIKTLVGVNLVTLQPERTRAHLYRGLEYEEKTVNVKPGENTADLDFLAEETRVRGTPKR
jgi:hypothetical protein